MLFGHQSGSDAGTQVLVEEACDFHGVDVFAALEESLRQGRDGVGMGADEIGHDFGEFHLFFNGGDLSFVKGFQGGE